MTVDDAEAYLHAGGNLIFPVSGVRDCLRLAEAAPFGGVHLTLVGQLNRREMLGVANAGGRHVTFDLTRDAAAEQPLTADNGQTQPLTWPHLCAH